MLSQLAHIRAFMIYPADILSDFLTTWETLVIFGLKIKTTHHQLLSFGRNPHSPFINWVLLGYHFLTVSARTRSRSSIFSTYFSRRHGHNFLFGIFKPGVKDPLEVESLNHKDVDNSHAFFFLENALEGSDDYLHFFS